MVALTKDKCQCAWGRGRQLCTGHRAHPAQPWLLAPNTPTRPHGPGSHGGPSSGLQRGCRLTCSSGRCSSCREAMLTGGKLRHSQLAVCLSHGKQQQNQSQSEASTGVPAHPSTLTCGTDSALPGDLHPACPGDAQGLPPRPRACRFSFSFQVSGLLIHTPGIQFQSASQDPADTSMCIDRNNTTPSLTPKTI